MLKRLKAAGAAFLIAIMVVAWPLFLALSMATLIGYIMYNLIRIEQKNKEDE